MPTDDTDDPDGVDGSAIPQPTPDELRKTLARLETLAPLAMERYNKALFIFRQPLKEMSEADVKRVTRIRLRRLFSPDTTASILNNRRIYAFWLVKEIVRIREILGDSGETGEA